ncbi:MAG: nitroreductase [Aquihabitans sp.]
MASDSSFASGCGAVANHRSGSTVAEVVQDVIRVRRTSLLVDPDASVPPALIEALLESAVWAPNHKRTWPWRFTVLTGSARRRLGDELAVAAAEAGLPAGKVSKVRVKYQRSPVVILVWVACDADSVRRREDRDATAAAVQNILLAATAHELASFWATVPDVLAPAVRSFAGVDQTHELVALVYLGWPAGEVPSPVRPGPEVTWLTE